MKKNTIASFLSEQYIVTTFLLIVNMFMDILINYCGNEDPLANL